MFQKCIVSLHTVRKFFNVLGGTVISATVIDKHKQCVSHTVGHTAHEG